MATLYVLVGIPGSGKSTYAEKQSAVVVSSDAIREQLFGNAALQYNPTAVFNLLHKRVKENLSAGVDVIYDATNVSKKAQKRILKSFPEAREKVAVYFSTPIEEAKERNAQRDRKVPTEVIERMFSSLHCPQLEDGWNKILIF